MSRRFLFALFAAMLCARTPLAAQVSDPLASWNDGPVKRSIVTFVERTKVPVEERIAVFDNDGTLWSEQPLYFQLQFMVDQTKAAAPQHPEWQDNPAFRALMANDHAALASMGHKPLLQLLAVANSGMTVETYDRTIRNWLRDARHPKLNRPYTELVYAPMQELLAYLRANGFKTFIVSGGSIEFMRPWTEAAYGIPPDQVIGTVSEVRFQMQGDEPVLMREPGIAFMDDGPGKPVGIYRVIGRRPLLAFGNSDGDLQMLQWTAAGEGPRFVGIVRHTDGKREWAYDRRSRIGKLDAALDEGLARNWTIVDMARDWKRVYPFEELGGRGSCLGARPKREPAADRYRKGEFECESALAYRSVR